MADPEETTRIKPLTEEQAQEPKIDTQSNGYSAGRGKNKTFRNVILHSTDGNEKSDVPRLTTSGEVGVHYYVTKDGRVMHFVNDGDSAWQAGKDRWGGNANSYTLGIEQEHVDGKEGWPDQQVQATARTVAAILKRNPNLTIDDVVGHSDIAGERKQDPVDYPWDKFRSYVENYLGQPVESPFETQQHQQIKDLVANGTTSAEARRQVLGDNMANPPAQPPGVQRAELVPGQAPRGPTGRVLKPYANIPTLIPEDAKQAQIDKDNADAAAGMRQQLGTHSGWQKDVYGNWWEVRNIGDAQHPHNILARADPTDPAYVTTWEKGQDPVRSLLGGDRWGGDIQKLRQTISAAGGENPLTKQPWPVDPLKAGYGQLRAMQRQIQRAHEEGMHEPSTGDTNGLNALNNTAESLRALDADYQAAGGKDGLNKIKQTMQGFKTATDWDHFMNDPAKNTQEDQQRIAYLKFMRDYQNASKAYGDVGKFSGTDAASSSVLDTLNGIFTEGGIMHPVISAFAGGLLGGLKKVVSGDFDPDAVRILAPAARAQVDRQLSDQVTSMGGDTGKTLLTEDQRDYGRRAQQDLYKMDIGQGDAIPEKAGLIQEPAKPQIQEPAKPQPSAAAAFVPELGPAAQLPGAPPVSTDQKPPVTAATPTPDQAAKDQAAKDKAAAELAKARAEPGPLPQKPKVMPVNPDMGQFAAAFAKDPGAAWDDLIRHPERIWPGVAPAFKKEFEAPKDLTPPWLKSQTANVQPIPASQITPGGPTTTEANETTLPPYVRGTREAEAKPEVTPPPVKPGPSATKPASTPPAPIKKSTIPTEMTPTGQSGPTEPTLMLPFGGYPATTSTNGSSNVEVGNYAANTGYTPPRLSEQEHVDGLEPGTPFYWRDHPDAYVKV